MILSHYTKNPLNIDHNFSLRVKRNVDAAGMAMNGSNSTRNSYYVELLLVLDKSIFDSHRQFYQTNDSNTIMAYMRLYFAHLVRGVNDRYVYSLRNDTNLSINIYLTNIMLITNVGEIESSLLFMIDIKI